MKDHRQNVETKIRFTNLHHSEKGELSHGTF